jgi:hypothetical protein
MTWPARWSAALSLLCNSSTPNCRSTARMPGSSVGSAFRAKSITRWMDSPGAISTSSAWVPCIAT